jgi:hypothetical protein
MTPKIRLKTQKSFNLKNKKKPVKGHPKSGK